MVVLVIYWRLFFPAAPLIGYTIITAAIFFLAAVQLFCLGILGEYLGHVYEEVKGRPLFTFKEVGGLGATPGLNVNHAVSSAGDPALGPGIAQNSVSPSSTREQWN
jgi:hypothetical protein